MLRLGIGVIIVAVFTLGVFSAINGDIQESTEGVECLPFGATKIADAGNGWVIFSYKNQQFLYHKQRRGDQGYECITWIPNSAE